MQISDFDFYLPNELIAQYPLANRSASRLLDASTNMFIDRTFSELPNLLNADDLLIFNNTRVLKARLFGKKSSGGQVELLVERILNEFDVLTHLKASNKPAVGSEINFSSDVQAMVLGRESDLFILRFNQAALNVLDVLGKLPLPPYIEHEATQDDETRYQTVYAKHLGAVAAPTAGLHFDENIFERLKQKNINTAFVTLHVGAGTFQPVRVENIAEHKMHSEAYYLPLETIQAIQNTKANGGRIIAVGTTSLRALESAMLRVDDVQKLDSDWHDTDIFIRPGFKFKLVDALITNFHLPKSTLLMLVSAFTSKQHVDDAYVHAIRQGYRFFSYGDAMWLTRNES